MSDRKRLLSLRLNESEWEALDEAASKLGLNRAEVTRSALACGIPLTLAKLSTDPARLVYLLERTQAILDMIVHREHADAIPDLQRIAQERMEKFHGAK